jgi:hypothetical protein
LNHAFKKFLLRLNLAPCQRCDVLPRLQLSIFFSFRKASTSKKESIYAWVYLFFAPEVSYFFRKFMLMAAN